MATNYDVNYQDPRFQDVTEAEADAIEEVTNTYTGIIDEADGHFQDQTEAIQKWEKTQTDIQNEQTEFAIEKIEQQKEQAHKDYIKEQSGAYTDWQKQSAQHGVNAEQMAANGMQNTGYSESSKVSMYNTYQNRVSLARDVYNRAVLNYDNAIKDARLQNNAALAEIAYNSLQQQLEVLMERFQYKNALMLDLVGKKMEIQNTYYQRWKDVYDQIYKENVLGLQNGGFGPIANDDGTKDTILNRVPENGFGWPNDAYKFLEENGIDRGDAKVLTPYDWGVEKKNGNTGKAFQYSTYREYLKAWVEWVIVNSKN